MSRMPSLTEEKVLVPAQLLRNLLLQIQDQVHKEQFNGASLLGYEEDGEAEAAVQILEEFGDFNGIYFELKKIVEGL